jgi:hypothetical protein
MTCPPFLFDGTIPNRKDNYISRRCSNTHYAGDPIIFGVGIDKYREALPLMSTGFLVRRERAFFQ